MTAENSALIRREDTGWSRGLDNLLAIEFGRWFRTKKWWTQILIWAAIVNGILALVVISEGSGGAAEPVMLFNVCLGLFASVGVCILMQGAIVGEKQSGTAAWVLSKPVSRPAFVLAKLFANSAGVALTIVLAQGLIAYILVYTGSGTMLSPLGVLAGLSVQLVHLFFYITLTLMLGAVFGRRGPVIAIPLLFLFVQDLLMGFFPVLAKVLPCNLIVPPDSGAQHSVASALMTGAESLSYLPLATTFGVSVLFVVVALWIFERLEF